MTAVCYEGYTSSPEIMNAATKVFQVAQLSIQRGAQKVAKNSRQLSGKGLERDSELLFKKLASKNRMAVRHIAGLTRASSASPLSALRPQIVRDFKLDLADPKELMMQAREGKAFAGLTMAPLGSFKWDKSSNLVVPPQLGIYGSELARLAGRRVVSGGAIGPSLTGQSDATELRLMLQSCEAVQRFGWEPTDLSGNDKIDCGGHGVGAGGVTVSGVSEYAQKKNVPSFRIGTFNRNGKKINMNPDKTFVKFDLSSPPVNAWPRAFSANVFIAETDFSGDFVDFLNKLWDEIGDEIIAISTSLATAAVGAGVGIAAGGAAAGTGAAAGAAAGTGMFPLIGTIIGALVGAVIGLIVGWIINSFADDIFETSDNPLGVILESRKSLFEGNQRTSPVQSQDFTLGGARYILKYYWSLA